MNTRQPAETIDDAFAELGDQSRPVTSRGETMKYLAAVLVMATASWAVAEDFAGMRGANYVPSYARNDVQTLDGLRPRRNRPGIGLCRAVEAQHGAGLPAGGRLRARPQALPGTLRGLPRPVREAPPPHDAGGLRFLLRRVPRPGELQGQELDGQPRPEPARPGALAEAGAIRPRRGRRPQGRPADRDVGRDERADLHLVQQARRTRS